MPFNGAGVYTVPAGTTAIPGQIIESAKYNAFLTDLQTAMSSLLLKNGVAAMAADLNMGGRQINNLSAGTLSTDALRYDQVFPTVRTKWLAPSENLIDADDVMTVAWDALTSNLVAIGSGSSTLITRIGAAARTPDGPYFLRCVDASFTFVHSATLVCPGATNWVAAAGDFLILTPFSIANGATPDAYRLVAARS